jgi:formamidopyrimidine-DNA glycosylase
MPELPEVETVRKGLQELIIGKKIKSVSSDWPKSFPNDQSQVNLYIINSSIIDVRRRAKLLIIDLSSGYSLVTHLKMTGQLVFRSNKQNFGAGHPSNSLVGKLPDKSTRVIISFSDSSKLFFNDQRKFGWMKLTEKKDILKHFTSIYGPEPLDSSFTTTAFKNRLLTRPRSVIKAVLLDQRVIAGVGNIYSDESLWAARIHPLTPTYQLTDQKIKLLHKSLIDVLQLAIKEGGSSDRNYVNAKGQKGSYIKIAKVFRREGQSCPRCNHEIKKMRVIGRGTHYCPYCQRLKIGKIES